MMFLVFVQACFEKLKTLFLNAMRGVCSALLDFNQLQQTGFTAYDDPRRDDVPFDALLIEARAPPGERLATHHVLQTLSAALGLLRRYRVNAALTIQLFSHLFHFVNYFLFNAVITERAPPAAMGNGRRLMSRFAGRVLLCRLARVTSWATRQGLDLAADAHLQRVSQCCALLIADKSSLDSLGATCAECLRLNSLQLRELLSAYEPDVQNGEPPNIPRTWIDTVATAAQNTSDELALQVSASCFFLPALFFSF